MSTTGTIRVNGEPRPLDAVDIPALLAREGVDAGARAVAVAVNGRVVPRGAWPEVTLAPGDDVEIVTPFAGG
jgi:sulfur carrier protein